jgi:hypothetical protein
MIHNIKSNFLDSEITKFVSGYVSNGYTINTETMRGSDGTNRVDLRKGNKFIRVWMERTSSYSYNKELDEKYDYWNDIFVLRVGYKELKNPTTDIVWSKDLAISYEQPYYKIGSGRYGEGAYTDDFEEVKHWMAVHYPRMRERSKREAVKTVDYKDFDRLKIGFSIVKKMPKTKSIHLENIKCVTRSRDWNGRLEYTVYYDTASGISKHVTVKPRSFSR